MSEAMTNPAQHHVDRFWSKVSRSEDPDGCWFWTGSITTRGYGQIQIERRKISTHRLSYFLATGRDPLELFVLHRCDTPACVNPAHLFIGTALDNMQDCKAKGRIATGAAVHPAVVTRNPSGILNWTKRNPHAWAGSANPNAKLTDRDIPVIVARFRAGESARSIGSSLGMSDTPIRRIVSGQTWKAVSRGE